MGWSDSHTFCICVYIPSRNTWRAVKLFGYEDQKGKVIGYRGSDRCIEEFFANAEGDSINDEAQTENYPMKLIGINEWGNGVDDYCEYFFGRLKDGNLDGRYLLDESFQFVQWNDIAKNHESDFEYEDCVEYFVDKLKRFTEYALTLRYAPIAHLSNMQPEEYVDDGEDYSRNKRSYHDKRLVAEEASLTAVFKKHLNEDVIRLVAEYNLPCNRIRIDYTCWNDNSDERWSYRDANDMDTTVCIL